MDLRDASASKNRQTLESIVSLSSCDQRALIVSLKFVQFCENGDRTCGISDGESFVLTGGGIPFLDGKRRGLELHNFFTRFDI